MYGFAVGDRVTSDHGRMVGLVLEMRLPAFYGPPVARVLWDARAGRAPHEKTRPVAELTAALTSA